MIKDTQFLEQEQLARQHMTVLESLYDGRLPLSDIPASIGILDALRCVYLVERSMMPGAQNLRPHRLTVLGRYFVQQHRNK